MQMRTRSPIIGAHDTRVAQGGRNYDSVRRARMQILKVRIRSAKEFQEGYARDLPHGGMFCPTTTELAPGAEVIVELAADELPNKVLLRGFVKWWRPALPRLRVRAGALVEFAAEEKDKRDFVLRVFGGGSAP